ncbi:MAG: dTDP-4-dehydrorhamnose reductase [Candidatus Bathyarchaeota archaeon]|nr:dTDP-4-dehydrorhamnose reductase [Candidatus Bathyarchaeota archaeon]MDH5494188.1 dTDP-4-dehydrorhamnose reductase [Candidatus Bathyarchaeota archaeon]
MEKILVTGASGLLGSKIVDKAEEKYAVYPTHTTHPMFLKSLKMNITDESEVKRIFSKVKPDVVIHTAAKTNVDKCETNKDYALRVNAAGTKILAEACRQAYARIVYVSTDYVFDGEKGLYTEEDEPNPINYYGLTKLMGEKYVAKLCERFVILRTSVLYGVHPEKPNFAMWIIKSLKKKKPLTVVEDHYNSPTFADNLAEVILEIVDKGLEGIYHTAGSERISRYGFALKVVEAFDFDASLVRSIKMSELKAWIAKRPKDSSLCVDKVKKRIDTELLGVTQGLREMNQSWVKTK